MGMYATADVVFGVPVLAHDNDGERTPFWDEENDDWIDIPDDARFQFCYFGHYDSYDTPTAILQLKDTPEWSGDCWDTTPVDPGEMVVREKDIRNATDEARSLGLPVDFSDAKWYLVASYG